MIGSKCLCACFLLCLPVIAAGGEAGETAYAPIPGGCGVVRTLRIERQDIFAPEEPYARTFYARFANGLHIVTRESVIRRGLRFSEGDRICQGDLDAAVRRLRSYPFLHAAIDVTAEADGDSVDLTIRTRDTWTTRPAFEFRAEGGLFRWSAALEEWNVLGTGKGVGLVVGHDDLDHYFGGWVRDSQLLGTEMRLLAASFGGGEVEAHQLVLVRHFERAVTPWGLRVEGLYRDAAMIDRRGGLDGPEWRVEEWLLSAAGGPRVAGSERTALRLKPAVYLKSERYARPTSGGVYPGADLARREIRALGAEVDLMCERYSQRSGINSFHRREDFNLGTDLRLRLGYSPRAAGALEDGFFFWLRLWQGLPMGPRQFLWATISAMGLVASGEVGDCRSLAAVRYYHNLSDRHTLALRLQGRWGVGLPPQRVFTLGAESGLRGFEAFRFWGERALLCNLEERGVLVGNLFGLVTLGLTGFVDTGLIWRAGHHEQARPRVGAGVGLRLLGSRTQGSLVTRVDIGYPILGGAADRGLVLSVASGQVF